MVMTISDEYQINITGDGDLIWMEALRNGILNMAGQLAWLRQECFCHYSIGTIPSGNTNR
jgi:hypothetical protein